MKQFRENNSENHETTESGADFEEWEELLEPETKIRDCREICFDPFIMETALSGYLEAYRERLLSEQEADPERWRLIDRIKAVVERKLPSPQKECVLMLLTTGCSYREIARRLGLSKDMVRRSVDRSVTTLRRHMNPEPQEDFPFKQNQSLRTKRFSIDTREEQEKFQEFLNTHLVVSISYSLSGDFREVLAIHMRDETD